MKLGILILVGGKSSRMNGFDKSQLTYRDRSFLDILTQEFLDFDNKYLSDNQYMRHHYDNYITIKDEYDAIGPMGGIVSTFHQSDCDALFVIACDNPLVSKDIVYLLYQYLDHYDGVFIEDEDYFYPLCAIYTRKMLLKLEKAIDYHDYSLYHCIKQCHVLKLSRNELNIQKEVLDNINTLEEYEMRKKQWKDE